MEVSLARNYFCSMTESEFGINLFLATKVYIFQESQIQEIVAII